MIAAAAIGAGLLFAPVATAAPGDCSGFHSGDADCGGHHWNGPLRQTWDTPGYDGGWTEGNQLLCSPFDYQCSGLHQRHSRIGRGADPNHKVRHTPVGSIL